MKSDNMYIREYIDRADQNRISLEFSVFSDGDTKNMLYTFEIYNLLENFEVAKYKDIGEEIDITTLSSPIYKHEEMKKFTACDLLVLLADTPFKFLLVKEKNSFKKYPLQYLSTARGWTVERYKHH